MDDETDGRALTTVEHHTARIPRPRSILSPSNFVELERFAKIAASSDFVPKDYKDKPANIMIAIEMGHELGLSPMQSLRGIAVVNGRPSMWGDALLGRVLSHPDCIDVIETITGKGIDSVARCEVRRRGREPVVRTWDKEDDRLAGLTGQGVHGKYPARMYQNRARGFALRDSFADVLSGFITTEEAMDYKIIEAEPVPADPPKRMTYTDYLAKVKASFDACSTAEQVEAATGSADIWWLKEHGNANIHAELDAIIATARQRFAPPSGLLSGESEKPKATRGRPKKSEEAAVQIDTPTTSPIVVGTSVSGSGLPSGATIIAQVTSDPAAVAALAPDFEAWLVNGDGEPIEDGEGASGKYTDPVAYARALKDALDAEFPATKELMVRANEDDAARAAALSQEAAAILATADVDETPPADDVPAASEPEATAPARSQWSINPPATETKAEWERFNASLKLMLQSAATPEAINTIVDQNSGVYGGFPPKYRTEAKGFVAARMKEISPSASAAPPAKPAAADLRDILLRDVADARTADELMAMERNPAIVSRLKTLHGVAPEMAAEVSTAAKARLAALKGGR